MKYNISKEDGIIYVKLDDNIDFEFYSCEIMKLKLFLNYLEENYDLNNCNSISNKNHFYSWIISSDETYCHLNVQLNYSFKWRFNFSYDKNEFIEFIKEIIEKNKE